MPSCVRVFALYARLILLSVTVHVGARGCVCMCVAVWSCGQDVRASRLLLCRVLVDWLSTLLLSATLMLLQQQCLLLARAALGMVSVGPFLPCACRRVCMCLRCMRG